MSDVRFWDLLVEEVRKQERESQERPHSQAAPASVEAFSKPYEDRLLTWLTAHTVTRPMMQDPQTARKTYYTTKMRMDRPSDTRGSSRAQESATNSHRPETASREDTQPQQTDAAESPQTPRPKQEASTRPMSSLEMLCLIRMNKWGAVSLRETMNERELKSAYRSLAKRFHPDRNPDAGVTFQEIRECYETLSAWLKQPAA